MRSFFKAGAVIVLGLSVFGTSACGSSVSGPTNALSPLPDVTPSPTAAPTSQSALVRGKVIDIRTGEALFGVSVSVAQPSADPKLVATSAQDGSFNFSVPEGDYDLIIGSNESAPVDNRATVHARIRLNPGANVLIAPSARPIPDVTPTLSQLGADFRLAVLSEDEIDCLRGMNAGRANAGLRALIPDEYSLENARAWVTEETAQGSDTPSPLWDGNQEFVPFSYVGITTAVASAPIPCSDWTNKYSFTPGNPPYNWATDPLTRFYGGSWAASPNGTRYGMQTWGR